MKNYIYLFYIFSIQFCLGQNPLIVSENNSDYDLEDKLDFFHDVARTRNINTIETALFSPYSNDNYFPDLRKQKFWFRVHLKNGNELPQNLLFKIRAYSFLKEVTIYKVNFNEVKKIFHIKEYLNRKIETNLILDKEATYYFEVDFAWTVMFRLEIISPKENQNKMLKENILQGLYYGFSFLILCLNILFYFFTKRRFFIYYVIFQLGIIASIAFLDNHIYLLTDSTSFNRAFGYLYNYIISLGSILFISNALHLKKRFPAFNYICHPILIISFLITSYYFLTGNVDTFNVITNLLILLFGFITAIYFSKKLVYARFIVAGYSVLFICHILYSLPVLLGYKDLGFYEWHYKIGSVIEMLIFMAAIPYRYKVLFTEKTTLEEKISTQEANFKKEIEILKNSTISVEDQLIKFTKEYDLKKREVEILEIMNTGATNKEIAEKLFISLDTVKHYCSSLYEKTGTKNRTKLIALFNERDVTETDK